MTVKQFCHVTQQSPHAENRTHFQFLVSPLLGKSCDLLLFGIIMSDGRKCRTLGSTVIQFVILDVAIW